MRVSGAMTIRLGRSRSPMRTGVKRDWTDMTALLGKGLSGQSALLEHDGHLPSVRRRPIVHVNHHCLRSIRVLAPCRARHGGGTTAPSRCIPFLSIYLMGTTADTATAPQQSMPTSHANDRTTGILSQ